LSFHSFQDAKLQNNYELQKKNVNNTDNTRNANNTRNAIINFGKGASRTGSVSHTGKIFGKVYTAK